MRVRRIFKVVAKYASGSGTFTDTLSDMTKMFKRLQSEGRIVKKKLIRTEGFGRKPGRHFKKVTSNQLERHALGRKGEEIVKKLYKGEYKAGTKPVDLVKGRTAFEIKTMSKYAKDKKIHMEKKPFERKMEYIKEKKLKPKTVAVIINDNIEVYEKVGFHQHLRPGQMKKVLEMPRIKKRVK